MPIIGLTDRVEPRFPRLGNLRKGGERDAQGRVGKDLDYFRFTADKPEIVAAFAKAFGPMPREVEIFLPYATVDANFPCWREEWSQNGLRHRCDGEMMALWLGPDQRYHTEPKPCPHAGIAEDKLPKTHCTNIGRLYVIIPSLVREGYVGYVTMQTGSTYDILGILATLRETVRVRREEDLTGVAFMLRRVEGDVPFVNDEGVRSRVNKWLVQLEPSQRWVLAQIEASQARALLSGALSPVQEAVDTETGEIVEAEAVESPAAVTQEPHWTQTDASKTAFFQALKERGMGIPTALAKLGCRERVGEFSGTFQQAIDRLGPVASAPQTAVDSVAGVTSITEAIDDGDELPF